MVGKELLEIYHEDSNDDSTNNILSTYVPTNADDTASESGMTDSVATNDNDDDTDDFKDAVDEEEKLGVGDMKAMRPSMGGMLEDDEDANVPNGGDAPPSLLNNNDDEFQDAKEEQQKNEPASTQNGQAKAPKDDSASNGTSNKSGKSNEPRRRFRDSLSTQKIEEAKATGRAQLGLAFEMLTMTKKRALKADPEAYQWLIDACGRVGDTKRATELLAKMHEDGIVADGTVYACLVSAFSNDTAWKKGTNEEELPGTSLLLFCFVPLFAPGLIELPSNTPLFLFHRMGQQHRCRNGLEQITKTNLLRPST